MLLPNIIVGRKWLSVYEVKFDNGCGSTPVCSFRVHYGERSTLVREYAGRSSVHILVRGRVEMERNSYPELSQSL